MNDLLSFKWTVSTGKNTYGYNILRLYINNKRTKYTTNGGGYDMKGTVLAQFIMKEFSQELVKNINKLKNIYGVRISYYPDKILKNIYLDGATGISQMEQVLTILGYKLTYKGETTNRSDYLFETL